MGVTMADGTLPVASDGEAGAGLVITGTSHKRPGFGFLKTISEEEQHAKRLRKVKQNVITTARLHVEEARQGGFRGRWAMVTCTYRDEERWIAKQLSALLTHVRNYATRSGFVARYTWVLELTTRGRPHYHVLVWLPKGRTLPKPDKQGWWPHGMTKIEWARNAVGYLAKYASKGIELAQRCLIPSGARMSGFGGLSKQSRIELRWWKLPEWVREHWSQVCDVARTKGGYVNRQDGEFLASRFLVVFFGGALVLLERKA